MILSRPVRSGGDKRFRGDQRSGTPNGARSTPGYLLTLLRDLSQCPRALTEIIMPKQVQKTNLDILLVTFQKKGWKIDYHVSNLRTRGFLFQGVQVHPEECLLRSNLGKRSNKAEV